MSNEPAIVKCTGKPAIGEFPSHRGCENLFPLEKHLQAENVSPKGKVRRLFARCPFCMLKYTVAYSNTKILHLQADLKILQKKEENPPKQEQLAEAIKAEQQRLKELYGI